MAAVARSNLRNPNCFDFDNVITSKEDGKNEYFVLDPALAGSSLQVYNRWGAKVYGSNDYQNDWDGQGLAPVN